MTPEISPPEGHQAHPRTAGWLSKTVLGSGSVVGIGALAAISPAAAITAMTAAAAVTIAALVIHGLPKIILARAIAETARPACSSAQAERALRVITGPEYRGPNAPAAGLINHVVGEPIDVASVPEDAEATPAPGNSDQPEYKAASTRPKLVA